MPLERPTLPTLVARTRAAVQGALPSVEPQLRRSLSGALATAVAGGLHELHGYLAWLTRQSFPDTAERAALDRWGSIWGVTRTPAARARGQIGVTGAAGAAVPRGTRWRRVDGAEIASTAAGVLDGTGAATLGVEAVAAGDAGNTAATLELQALSPVPQVYSTATVTMALAGGAPEETDEALRARLLARIRRPPHAGIEQDYEQWARAASTRITRVWVRPLTRYVAASPPSEVSPALGEVAVYFMTDGATANGIPDAAVVTAARTAIASRRPVTAVVEVQAPAPSALAVELATLAPNSLAVQAAVEAEIADLLRREASPGGDILLSHVSEAISAATGETDHRIARLGGTAVADLADPKRFIVADAHIAVPGTITWPSQ